MSSVLLWTRSVCEGGCLYDAAIRHKVSCSFDMAYDSNYLDRMLQPHGRNLQPSWRACRSRKRTHNKDKIWCCGCGEYFFMSIYRLNKMVAYRSYWFRLWASEVFWGFEILTWCGLDFVAFKDSLGLLDSKPSIDRGLPWWFDEIDTVPSVGDLVRSTYM